MASGAWNPDHSPQEVTEVSHWTLMLCVQASASPTHQLQFTKQRRDMKMKCLRGPTFFKGKKRLNYIFKRHRHAEEYQQCLRPEAEMPRMRIWKINTVELRIMAFFFSWGS